MHYIPLPEQQNHCIDSPAESVFIKRVTQTVKTHNNQILGRGRFGTVFRATYKSKPVAVKLIKRSNSLNRVDQIGESNILCLNHTNIIKILKIKCLLDYQIIIMEYICQGFTLQNLLDQIEIPICHRLKILKDLLHGLCYCHSNQIIHLDIKPINILISFDNDGKYICKICDFGSSINIRQHIQTDRLCEGTIRYMSPERLQGHYPNYKDDIFSIGISMWQLKTRQYPYNQILSNDTVAYNVVKYQIRPNNNNLTDELVLKPKIIINSCGNNVSTNKKTTENTLNLSSNLKLKSLKVKQTLFHEGKCITPKYFKTKLIFNKFESIERKLPTRIISENIKEKINYKDCSHNIVKKLDFSSKSENIFQEYDFNKFLHVKFNKSDKQFDELEIIESQYQQTYEKCWNIIKKIRPTTKELLWEINEMLVKFQ